MACSCSKNKKSTSSVSKVSTPQRQTRPLNESGITRRREKRIIR